MGACQASPATASAPASQAEPCGLGQSCSPHGASRSSQSKIPDALRSLRRSFTVRAEGPRRLLVEAAEHIELLAGALGQIAAETDTIADFEGIRFRNFAKAVLRGEATDLWAENGSSDV